jgi:hypothetical protein
MKDQKEEIVRLKKLLKLRNKQLRQARHDLMYEFIAESCFDRIRLNLRTFAKLSEPWVEGKEADEMKERAEIARSANDTTRWFIKNPKMGKLVDPLIKALQSRNDSLVFRGGDFYINTEEKLAEEVSGLYGQVTSYPGRPGATQVERVGSLDEELKKADQKFEKIKKDKLKKVNDKLTSDKLFEPIKVQTEEEFKKGEAGGGGIKQNPFNWYYLFRH